MSAMSVIEDFLSQDRIAVVGVSRNPKDFSRTLLRELRTRGYDVIPVNPEMEELEGEPCFAHVQDIQPAPGAAILMTCPEVTQQVVHECAQAGVSKVWMYRAGTTGGSVSEDAIHFCESKGMSVVPGECPLMFLPATGWWHRLHGFVRKITGRYPH